MVDMFFAVNKYSLKLKLIMAANIHSCIIRTRLSIIYCFTTKKFIDYPIKLLSNVVFYIGSYKALCIITQTKKQ